jgi:hypothetical protein
MPLYVPELIFIQIYPKFCVVSTKILRNAMIEQTELSKRIEEACANRSHLKAAQYLGIKASTYSAIVAPKEKEPTSINLKLLQALFDKGISSDWIIFASLPKYVFEKGEHQNQSDLDKIIAMAATLSVQDRQELLRRLLVP